MMGTLRFDEMNPDDPILVLAFLGLALIKLGRWLWPEDAFDVDWGDQ